MTHEHPHFQADPFITPPMIGCGVLRDPRGLGHELGGPQDIFICFRYCNSYLLQSHW